MDTIVHRAEQAVLGALLAAPSARPPSDIAPGDFADRRHRAIFAALTGAGPQPGGLLNRLRAWLAGLPWRQQVRDLHAYLDQLPAACPDPGHLPRYAAMVHQASQQRGTTAAAGQPAPDLSRLAGAVAWLERETEKAATQRRRPHLYNPAGDSVPRDIAVATSGLRAAAREAGRSGQTPVSAPGSAAVQRNGTVREVPVVLARPERRPARHEDLEELVLADLMQRPDEAREIIGWLPAEVFTSGIPRAIYGGICHRVQAGEPVDPLIIAWDLHRARELQRSGGDREIEGDQELDPGCVLRIAALDAAPGSAALVGRALLADHLYTNRFGAGWQRLARFPGFVASDGPVPDAQPGAPAVEPHAAPRPEQAAAPGPEPAAKTAPAVHIHPGPELVRPSQPAASGPLPRP
jgi:hypothetical protein